MRYNYNITIDLFKVPKITHSLLNLWFKSDYEQKGLGFAEILILKIFHNKNKEKVRFHMILF